MSVRKKQQLIRTPRADAAPGEVHHFRRTERQRVRLALENILKNTEYAEDFTLPDLERPWYYRSRHNYSYRVVRRLLSAFVGRPWVKAHQYICKNFSWDLRHAFFDNVQTEAQAACKWHLGEFTIDKNGILRGPPPPKPRRSRRSPVRYTNHHHSQLLTLAGWLDGKKVRKIGADYFFMEATHERVVSFVVGWEIKWSIDYAVGYNAMIQKLQWRQGRKMTKKEVSDFLSFPENVRDKAILPLNYNLT